MEGAHPSMPYTFDGCGILAQAERGGGEVCGPEGVYRQSRSDRAWKWNIQWSKSSASVLESCSKYFWNNHGTLGWTGYFNKAFTIYQREQLFIIVTLSCLGNLFTLWILTRSSAQLRYTKQRKLCEARDTNKHTGHVVPIGPSALDDIQIHNIWTRKHIQLCLANITLHLNNSYSIQTTSLQ